MVLTALILASSMKGLSQWFEFRSVRALDTHQVPRDVVRVAPTVESWFAFIAENGAAVGLSVDRFSSWELPRFNPLAEHDRFDGQLVDGIAHAWNISQEIQTKRIVRDAKWYRLMPVVMLDQHRTLCMNSAPSIHLTGKTPTNHLFVALIDDRQRGLSANRAMVIPMLGDTNGLKECIESRGDNFVVRQVGVTEAWVVDMTAKSVRVIKSESLPRLPSKVQQEMQQLKVYWPIEYGGRWYYRSREGNQGFIWDGKRLGKTGEFILIAASPNGRFAWAFDKASQTHYRLSR